MRFLGSPLALIVASLLLGAFLCAVYDLFRVFRLRHRINTVILFFSDLAYSAIVSASMLLLFFNLTYGRVRVYAFFIMLFGFLIWRFTVSRVAIGICMRLADWALKLLNLSKMRVLRFSKRASRRIYTAFYCRATVYRSRHGYWKGSLK